MAISRLAVTLTPTRPLRWAPVPGMTLRGAFGHALKDAVCTRAHRTCPGCDRAGDCPFPTVFEPHRAADAGPTGPARPPAPYVLRWREPDRRLAAPPLELEMLLLGPASELTGPCRTALELAGMRGLGASRVPMRAQWSAGSDARPIGSLVAKRVAALAAVECLSVHLQTPLRLVERGIPLAFFDLPTLLRTIWRRARLLGPRPGNASDDRSDPGAPAPVAVGVEVERLEWLDVGHDSRRQGRVVRSGGLVGRVALRGPLMPLLPWLALAELIQVGKWTTAGFGRIVLEPS